MAAVLLTACSDNRKTEGTDVAAQAADGGAVVFVGEWVKPIEGQDGVEGVKLSADGTASSVNRATLVYSSWEQKGDTVLVKGESIGNGMTIAVVDTMLVKGDSLVQLSAGTVVAAYGKRD